MPTFTDFKGCFTCFTLFFDVNFTEPDCLHLNKEEEKKKEKPCTLTVTVAVPLSDAADCHCWVSVVFYLLLWMFVDIKQQVCISLRTTKRHRNVIAWCVALFVVLMQLSDWAAAVAVLYAEVLYFFQFLYFFVCVSCLIIIWKEHLIARCFRERTESFPSRGPGHVGDKPASLLLTVIVCFLWDFLMTLYRHFIFSLSVEPCHRVCCRGSTAHLQKLAMLK